MTLENSETAKRTGQSPDRKPIASVGKNRQVAAKGQSVKTKKTASSLKAAPINRPDKDKGTSAPPKTISNILGEITWLMTQSTNHRYFFISDLEWMILQPVCICWRNMESLFMKF